MGSPGVKGLFSTSGTGLDLTLHQRDLSHGRVRSFSGVVQSYSAYPFLSSKVGLPDAGYILRRLWFPSLSA
jgi:hypothetical protein